MAHHASSGCPVGIGLRLFPWIAAALAVMPAPAGAREARVTVDDPPHFAGLPVRLEVVAEGFDADATLVCAPPTPPPGVTLRFVGRSTNNSMRIVINNRVHASRATQHFVYAALVETPGRVELGPFTVTHDNTSVSTKAMNLAIREVELDPDMRVSVEAPPGPFYVGQRVPITVQWWYAGNIKSLHHEQLSIRSPLFDLFPFENTAPREGNQLPLETEAGRIAVNAEVGKRSFNGREFLVVSARRTMQIDRVVDVEHALPLRATALVVTRWQRGFFGDSPAAFRPIRAEGEPVRIRIQPLPRDDAPPGFAGAVGHGFSIQAEADRSVVQVGDPIKVTVTVRGDADLRHIALPDLNTESEAPGTGIAPERFRLSDAAPAGEVLETGRAKRFEITLRPLDTTATQIPPLLFSWFDPTTKRYETTRSNPIALSTEAARVIGAADVVQSEATMTPPDQDAPRETGNGAPEHSPRAGQRFDLSGADLSIQKEKALLLSDDGDRFGGPVASGAVYVLSWLLVGGAAWWHCRDRRDPRLVAMHKAVREQVGHIRDARHLPKQAAARQIAAALRQLAPMTAQGLRPDLERVVAECDDMVYARGDDEDGRFDLAVHERAMAVARRVKEVA